MNRIDNSLKALSIDLPVTGRRVEKFHLSEPRHFPERSERKLNRIAFAATHVVADPHADNDPWLDCAIDWDKTIAYRRPFGARSWCRGSDGYCATRHGCGLANIA